jgi:nucleotide-binding universal stress UspA family protein
LRKVVLDLDKVPDAVAEWWVLAKSQGAAFHLYAMSRISRSADEAIEAIEKTVDFGGYQRIYDYVVRKGPKTIYKEVKSWKPEYVLQNLRDELKLAKKGGGSTPSGPTVDPVDPRLRDAKPDSDKKGGGQLFRDLVHLNEDADAIVEYELRHGSPDEDTIKTVIKEALKNNKATRDELGAIFGVDPDNAAEFAATVETLLQRLKFSAIPDP